MGSGTAGIAEALAPFVNQQAGKRAILRRGQADRAVGCESQIRARAGQVNADLCSGEHGRLVHDKRTILDDVDTARQRDLGASCNLETLAIHAWLKRPHAAAYGSRFCQIGRRG